MIGVYYAQQIKRLSLREAAMPVAGGRRPRRVASKLFVASDVSGWQSTLFVASNGGGCQATVLVASGNFSGKK